MLSFTPCSYRMTQRHGQWTKCVSGWSLLGWEHTETHSEVRSFFTHDIMIVYLLFHSEMCVDGTTLLSMDVQQFGMTLKHSS